MFRRAVVCISLASVLAGCAASGPVATGEYPWTSGSAAGWGGETDRYGLIKLDVYLESTSAPDWAYVFVKPDESSQIAAEKIVDAWGLIITNQSTASQDGGDPRIVRFSPPVGHDVHAIEVDDLADDDPPVVLTLTERYLDNGLSVRLVP